MKNLIKEINEIIGLISACKEYMNNILLFFLGFYEVFYIHTDIYMHILM